MTSLPTTPLQYFELGLNPVAVSWKDKKPVHRDWETRLYGSAAEVIRDFPPGKPLNCGLLLGSVSHNIVDGDLDYRQAIEAAAYYLPQTPMRFGRRSKRNSHRLYCADFSAHPDLPATIEFIDPDPPKPLPGTTQKKLMIAELRIGGLKADGSNKGAQTIVPGSVHPSGEPVEWEPGALPVPAIVIPGIILPAMAKTAAAALLASRWPGQGTFHHASLCLGGLLARAGWAMDEISVFVSAVVAAGQDSDLKERLRCAQDTALRFERGERCYGKTEFEATFGDKVTARVCKWLELKFPRPGASPVAGVRTGFTGARTATPPPGASPQTAQATIIEDAIALDFVDRYHQQFLYDHTRGSWYRWTGATWALDAVEYTYDCARTLIREWRQGSLQSFGAVERMSRADQRVAIDHSRWNADPWLIGTPTGAVDLKTGDFLAADPLRYINQQTAVTPAVPGTPHPLWTEFLNEAAGKDEDLIRYLRMRAGYWLTGEVNLEDFDFFFGPGGCGKGTFLKTILAVMGDYATTAPFDMFTVKSYEGHPAEFARLAHVRLVIASEVEEGKTWALSKLKQLTGNETRIPARFLHRDWFEFWPKFKLVFAGNHKPRLTTVDDAIGRRLRVVPFTHKPKSADTALKEKLATEYPAILRWQIDGLLDWRASGLIIPDAVRAATTKYLSDEDVLMEWLAECCVRQGSALLKDLYFSWQEWCRREVRSARSSRWLREKLEEKVPSVFSERKEEGIWVINLQLTPEEAKKIKEKQEREKTQKFDESEIKK